MEAGIAYQDRYRLGSKEICLGCAAGAVETLPLALQDLLERSDKLYRRIARLDDVLFGEASPVAGARGQQDALSQAFAVD
jgi:regulator of CtrA degradation